MIVLAFDVETTGLIESRLMPDDRQPYVIQFCGVLVDLSSGEVHRQYDTFIRPPRRNLLTAKIISVTHIDWDDLQSAPAFSNVADTIITMIESAPAAAAHNISFDKEMIDIEARRLGRTVKWPEKLICSVEQSVHLKGKRLNLTNLHDALVDASFTDAHRAVADTEALVRCLVEMHRRDWL